MRLQPPPDVRLATRSGHPEWQGTPTVEFVKAIRKQRKGMPLYALSVMGAAATLKAMGADATGITVSQVMPLPANWRSCRWCVNFNWPGRPQT